MYSPKTCLFTLSAVLLLIVSCKKETPQNKVPVSDAGLSKNITLPTSTVTLTGTGTDADGKVVGYLWSQVAGPAPAIIVNPGSPSTVINGFVEGSYIFQLMVTDDLGATGLDTCIVKVNPNPIKTLTLQPNNNANEISVSIYDGGNVTGPTLASLEPITWTKNGLLWITRGLVKFDLSTIPANAVIQSANLYLYSNPTPTTGDQVNANSGPANSFTIQQVTATWSPATITWANQPASATSNQIVIAQTAQAMLDLNVDVTGMVASMVSNNTNYGFLLKLQSEVTYNSRIFVASHNQTYADKHPKLVVVYQ